MSVAAPAEVRVGVDVVAVSDVSASVRHFGARYVERIYTPHEIDCCRRTGSTGSTNGELPAYAMDSLAARFAAKEAVIKVLRPVGYQPDWRSIELHRKAGGWCEIHLSGHAAELAADAGIDGLAVSVSHEAGVAAAVVVGWSASDRSGQTERSDA